MMYTHAKLSLLFLQHWSQFVQISYYAPGCKMQVGYDKIRDFRPISCYISETVQDRDNGDIVTMEA